MYHDKMKIWTKKALEHKDEKQLYLRLVNLCGDDDILLQAVNWKGEKISDGNILDIDQSKKVIIALSNINEAIPLRQGLDDEVLFYPQWQVKALRSSLQSIGIPLGRTSSLEGLVGLLNEFKSAAEKHEKSQKDSDKSGD